MTVLENIMQNLYRNLDPKASKDPRGAELSMKALKADTAAKLLEGLLQGESTVIKGKVLDLRQDNVLLQLLNGEKLSARTESPLPLSIGDTAEFIVAGKDGKLITLKLAGNETTEDTQTQKTVAKALENAGIALTERSENTVKELMLHSQPLNESNIRKFMALSARYPDVPLKELVLMDIAKIPLTKENIEIYQSFDTSEPVAEFAAAVAEISENIDALPEGASKEALKTELKNILNEILPSESSSGSVSEESAADQASGRSENITFPASTDNSEAAEKAKVPGASGALKPSESADPLAALPSEDRNLSEKQVSPRSGEALSESPDPKQPKEKLSANDIHSALHLPPKDIEDPKNVKKLYEKLESVSEKLRRLEERVAAEASENAKEAAAKSQPQTHASRLSSSLKFMDSVNSIFPYVQLPIKLKEENARGDLYVYEKKRAFKEGDTVSALLHLDLDNLGETDILIKLTGRNAVVTISASSENAKEAFSSEVPALSEALGKKGYSLNCDVNVSEEREEKVPLLTQFLEAHSPSLVTRFSFDMRA